MSQNELASAITSAGRGDVRLRQVTHPNIRCVTLIDINHQANSTWLTEHSSRLGLLTRQSHLPSSARPLHLLLCCSSSLHCKRIDAECHPPRLGSIFLAPISCSVGGVGGGNNNSKRSHRKAIVFMGEGALEIRRRQLNHRDIASIMATSGS